MRTTIRTTIRTTMRATMCLPPLHLTLRPGPKLYNPRHPDGTLLYQTIAEHFQTWLELASAGRFSAALNPSPALNLPPVLPTTPASKVRACHPKRAANCWGIRSFRLRCKPKHI